MQEEIEKNIRKIEGWKLVGESIEKNYRFKDFRHAIEFVNRVADLAEEANHHPDILVWSWNNVKLTLTTHAVRGLSKNDFAIASKIDQIKIT